jgi:hypothetical protein
MFQKMLLLNPIALNTFVMKPTGPLEVWGVFAGPIGGSDELVASHTVPGS